jgi:membrane protease YdiL (CAAX protease family)
LPDRWSSVAFCRPERHLAAESAALAVLAVWNPVVNRVLPAAWYVPANLSVAAALVALARRGGATWVELGVDRTAAPAGLRLGAKVAVVVGAVIGLGAVLPSTRSFFADARYRDLSAAGLAYQALVRIPLGTVVLEELAFRGVLPAVFARSMSVRKAVAASSTLFGLWHILPTLSAATANDLSSGVAGRAGLVAGAVGATTVAGVLFCGLRLRSGSVVAPMLAHTATNSLGVVVAFTVLRRQP